MAELLKLAEQVVGTLKAKGLFITAVESCTGGGLANCITNIPGASDVMLGARVAYSSEEKIALGVPEHLTLDETIYSMETAVAMAKAGVAAACRSDVGVGITGQLSFPDPCQENRVYIAVVFGDVTVTDVAEFPVEYERWKAKEDVIEKVLHLVLGII
ncbi:MAG: CinA family protein [Kiritimatiellales bacterium]|nr:CinA family protein [Kiritimatiellales bacterium]